MWRYLTSLACGVAIGIVIDKILQHYKTSQTKKYSGVLEKCFGEPMIANTFSLAEVRDWSKSREEQLKAGNKIAVIKATPENIEDIGKKLDIGKGVDNYLVMAVVNEERKDLVESILVKYEKLDKALDDQLAKGNGTLIIGA